MARRPAPQPATPPTIDAHTAHEKLKQQLEDGERLAATGATDEGQYSAWYAETRHWIEQAFGERSVKAQNFEMAGVGPIVISSAIVVTPTQATPTAAPHAPETRWRAPAELRQWLSARWADSTCITLVRDYHPGVLVELTPLDTDAIARIERAVMAAANGGEGQFTLLAFRARPQGDGWNYGSPRASFPIVVPGRSSLAQ